jgi:multicomponent Na+:H+ antiporter subunit E
MSSKAVLFIFALTVWGALDWVPDWQHIAVGIPVAAFVVFMTGDFFITRPHILRHPSRYWYLFVRYLPLFVWECVKANLDVAYRVLSPRLPIKPGIVRVKTTLCSETGLTFLANSITLTPGTMSVDIDRERGVLYVHWINVRSTEVDTATKLIVQRFEPLLQRIFEDGTEP